jgi:hypothetical protein
LALATALATFVFATAPDTADDMFAHAKAEATQDHKHILLVFSDSRCGYCKLYDRFLEDRYMKPITEKAFVIQRIDIGLIPGGVRLRTAIGAVHDPGMPFLVMTDENGSPIINSFRNGDTNGNIGYPALPVEIDWYIEMLKRAAPTLSANDLAATRAWLKAHAPR